MPRVKGWCALCEKYIFKGHVTKRVKSTVEHEDFRLVHLSCHREEFGRVVSKRGAVPTKHHNILFTLANNSSPRNLDVLVRKGLMSKDERKETLERWEQEREDAKIEKESTGM